LAIESAPFLAANTNTTTLRGKLPFLK